MKFRSNRKFRVLIVVFLVNFIFISIQMIEPITFPLDRSTLDNDSPDDNECFILTQNGMKYLVKYITAEDVEEMTYQNQQYNLDPINGCLLPSEKELHEMIGQVKILERISGSNLRTSGPIYDLSNETYFPIVGNQGSQGSCAAWAVTYYSMGYLEAKDNGWDASSGNTSCLLSPAWSFNKASSDSYSGSSLVGNAQVIKDFGAATMSTMPYNPSNDTLWGDETAWRDAPKHAPQDYFTIAFNPITIVATIKSVLEGGTPVAFCIDSTEYTPGLSDNYILSSSEYNSPSIDHANCIVGFNDSITEDGDTGAFKVVNSWGPSFEDNGYYWLTYDAFKEINGVGGILYLTDKINFQPTLLAIWNFSTSPEQMNDIITVGVGPYSAPLATITPDYTEDLDDPFPLFMALDISEFYTYYDSNNDVNFYLEIGPSNSSGTITSFKIERFASGALVEISDESVDVPETTPGYVQNHLSTCDLTSPTILHPNGGEFFSALIFINWTGSTSSFGHSITYGIEFSSNNGYSWVPIVVGLTTLNYTWVITGGIFSNDSLIKVIATCSGGQTAEDVSDAVFSVSHDLYIPSYDLFLFTLSLSIVTLLSIKRLYKKKKIER